ncbi:hypothetical protein B0H11DRAFT_212758 [Mycena galericulata]|nr:hypothetical protein B0H11DRAFT_212758 [Mycena galericulata]
MAGSARGVSGFWKRKRRTRTKWWMGARRLERVADTVPPQADPTRCAWGKTSRGTPVGIDFCVASCEAMHTSARPCPRRDFYRPLANADPGPENAEPMMDAGGCCTTLRFSLGASFPALISPPQDLDAPKADDDGEGEGDLAFLEEEEDEMVGGWAPAVSGALQLELLLLFSPCQPPSPFSPSAALRHLSRLRLRFDCVTCQPPSILRCTRQHLRSFFMHSSPSHRSWRQPPPSPPFLPPPLL